MDSNTGGILSIFAFIFTAAGMIYAAVNHKRIRCKCCGKDMDMSMDVDSTKVAPTPSGADDIQEGTPDEEAPGKEVPPEEEVVVPVVIPPRKKKRLPPLPPRVDVT